MELDRFTGRIGVAARMQLALDGEWERAWRLNPDRETPARYDLKRWLDRSSSFAFEVFFEDIGFGEFFAGVRPEGFDADRSATLTRSILANLRAHPSFEDTIRLLRDSVSRALFADTCDFVALGQVDAWRSTRAYRLWSKGEGRPSPKALWRRLERSAPQHVRPQQGPVAAEIAFVKPCPHWLGIPVSGGGGGLDWRLLSKIVALAASRAPSSVAAAGSERAIPPEITVEWRRLPKTRAGVWTALDPGEDPRP